MNTLFTLSGWDITVVFALGSLSGACLMEASRIWAEWLRRRTTTRLQRSRWREQAMFNLRPGRTAE